MWGFREQQAGRLTGEGHSSKEKPRIVFLLTPEKGKERLGRAGQEKHCRAEGDAEITARHGDAGCRGLLTSSSREGKGLVCVSRFEEQVMQVAG